MFSFIMRYSPVFYRENFYVILSVAKNPGMF